METDSGQRAMVRRREGARGRRERRLRAEARIRLQLCRDAVRIASHRGGDGCRRAHTEASTQTAPVYEPPVTDFVTPAPAVPHVAPVAVFEYVSPAPVIECVAPAVGSLPPYEVFSAPVCNQVHQELFAASEMTENNAEIPVVQEQVIVQEIRCGVPAVFQAASPVVEHRAPAPGVQAPTLVEENIAHAPAVIHSPTPVVESVAPAPALSEAPAPGVEHISPASAGLFPVPMVANIAPELSVSHSPALWWSTHLRQLCPQLIVAVRRRYPESRFCFAWGWTVGGSGCQPAGRGR